MLFSLFSRAFRTLESSNIPSTLFFTRRAHELIVSSRAAADVASPIGLTAFTRNRSVFYGARVRGVRIGLRFYIKNLFYRTMRLRLERFLFDQTYYRTYVYFKNILNLALYRFHFWKSAEVYFNGIASSAGKTFLITEGFNVMLIRAMGFVFTVVGWLFLFKSLFKQFKFV